MWAFSSIKIKNIKLKRSKSGLDCDSTGSSKLSNIEVWRVEAHRLIELLYTRVENFL